MLKKIQVYISVLAVLVMITFGLLTDRGLSELALPLIIAIIVFYIAGLFIRYYLSKYIFITEDLMGSESIEESGEAQEASMGDEVASDEEASGENEAVDGILEYDDNSYNGEDEF